MRRLTLPGFSMGSFTGKLPRGKRYRFDLFSKIEAVISKKKEGEDGEDEEDVA